MPDPGEITRLLQQVQGGSRSASEFLFEAVYDDLRRLAASQLRSERSEHTLQATALVHEVYLRMVGQSRVE